MLTLAINISIVEYFDWDCVK